MSKPRVILLEFNELCPDLLQSFMQQGKLPNFQRFFNQSHTFITDSKEEPPYLEPWIQWVTVHSGLPYSAHQVFRLDESHKVKTPQIWDLVCEQNESVCLFGSMNVKFNQGLKGVVLPDPWSSGVSSHPANEFADFLPFIKMAVAEHTRNNLPAATQDYLKFLRFLVARGLTPTTCTRLGKQLIDEKLTGKYHWRRATLLDAICYDVFRYYYTKLQPQFATLFMNSVAHFQHSYWRYMEPEKFQGQIPLKKQQEFGDAIVFGYQCLDRLVGKLLQLAKSNVTLVFATALSQQPCLDYENNGGKHFYRPVDITQLLTKLNIEGEYQFVPVMSEEFQLHFSNEANAQAVEEKLRNLTVGEVPLFIVKRHANIVYSGCGIYEDVKGDPIISNVKGEVVDKFYTQFYQAEQIKSGKHHSSGILWIRQPSHTPRQHDKQVHLLDVAPTVLSLMDIKQPSFMQGHNLLK